MKGQLKVSSPVEYISQLDEPRKTDIAALDALVRKAAPELQPFIYSGMLGYGPYRYKYASGREGDGSRIAISSNANYISLYLSATDGCADIAGKYKAALPKAKIGKCCVRFKRLSDLDLKTVNQMLVEYGQWL